jgi:hypothetical protein
MNLSIPCHVRLDNDLCGLFACNTSFALVTCLITSLRAWDWRAHPRVTIVIFAKIVARRFDARDALLLETLSRVESYRNHIFDMARGIADRPRRPRGARSRASFG